MRLYFNTAGPCVPRKHYMLPVLERNPEVKKLVDSDQYFVIHAARQTGKTTLLKTLAREINAEGERYALYCSLESVEFFTEPEKGIPEILNNLDYVLKHSTIPYEDEFVRQYRANQISTDLKTGLTDLTHNLDKPLIIFFDEIDCLSNGTLVTFLRQLRDGYINREDIPFPDSIALVGMRNIRDYKSKIREGRETLGGASPFNIITKSLTLHNFSKKEIQRLLGQHTEVTGQPFTSEAIDLAYYYTEGQPWLVNAIARECVVEILDEDFSRTIDAAMIEQAKEQIIQRRDTHIDSLVERLKEERVREIMEKVITGNDQDFDILDDSVQYCLDLGLLKDNGGELTPSNPIYREVIIRTLTYNMQFNLISKVENKWAKSDTLDMQGLLEGFQQFWRENSEIWIEKYRYKEAAPHLLLQAFLQRVINSGGIIIREYATNRGRVDLNVIYADKSYPIEIKIYYSEKTIRDGLEQLSRYMDTLGCNEGWLVIFDRSGEKSWDEKIYTQTREISGKAIHLIGV